jgi:hypothetical protein
MGNIANLVLLEEDRSPFLPRPILREAKNSIPVLWLALFGPDDANSFNLPLAEGSSLSVPGLCTPLKAAAQRLSQRTARIQSWLPGELHHFLAEFREEIESQSAPRIGLDPAEFALLLETDDLQSSLHESTDAFDNLEPDALASLFDVTGLDFDVKAGRVVRWKEPFAEYALRGYRDDA